MLSPISLNRNHYRLSCKEEIPIYLDDCSKCHNCVCALWDLVKLALSIFALVPSQDFSSCLSWPQRDGVRPLGNQRYITPSKNLLACVVVDEEVEKWRVIGKC